MHAQKLSPSGSARTKLARAARVTAYNLKEQVEGFHPFSPFRALVPAYETVSGSQIGRIEQRKADSVSNRPSISMLSAPTGAGGAQRADPVTQPFDLLDAALGGLLSSIRMANGAETASQRAESATLTIPAGTSAEIVSRIHDRADNAISNANAKYGEVEANVRAVGQLIRAAVGQRSAVATRLNPYQQVAAAADNSIIALNSILRTTALETILGSGNDRVTILNDLESQVTAMQVDASYLVNNVPRQASGGVVDVFREHLGQEINREQAAKDAAGLTAFVIRAVKGGGSFFIKAVVILALAAPFLAGALAIRGCVQARKEQAAKVITGYKDVITGPQTPGQGTQQPGKEQGATQQPEQPKEERPPDVTGNTFKSK